VGGRSGQEGPEQRQQPAHLSAAAPASSPACSSASAGPTIRRSPPDRLGCSAAQGQGPAVCANTRTVSRRQVEERLLHGLQAGMLEPAAIQLYVEEYHAPWAERRKDAT
jgi:hypothetical protein